MAFLFVVFVQNVADDLLQNILHRHKACRLSVFIDDHRHLDFFLLHFPKQRIDLFLLRHKDSFSEQIGNILHRHLPVRRDPVHPECIL